MKQKIEIIKEISNKYTICIDEKPYIRVNSYSVAQKIRALLIFIEKNKL